MAPSPSCWSGPIRRDAHDARCATQTTKTAPMPCMSPAPESIEMFGLRFERVALAGAVEQVMAAARAGQTGLVVTPNVDQVVKFGADPFMHLVYRSALHVYADGMPLVWLSHLLDRRGLPGRVTGADLLPAVCREAAREGRSVYFCGGAPGVAQAAADRMRACHAQLVVAGVSCPPWGFESDVAVSARLVEEINRSAADILFLGVGAPKQEKWGYNQLGHLKVGPVLCVGAAFSFAADLVRRAPTPIRRCGMEWAWRLAQEPRRLWRRYLVDDMRIFVLAWRELRQARQRGQRR
jgi:N-acetylglucosaminyldiphosphoundecaprenol N-acetyl-beta-D-mannosaminyltransferase